LINRSCLLCISVLLLLLGGCASVATPPPAEVTIATPDVVAAEPAEVPIPAPLPPPVISENRAVIALLDRSRLDNGGGQREAAGASLERALRIEPRNGWLWHELAQLRLAQGQYAQAASLAQKSISFAARERRLQALNWRVIGNARVAQGNPAGAEQAFKLAVELEK
jgi:predicted Zn-dependent protease